jgi:hypothetical protein
MDYKFYEDYLETKAKVNYMWEEYLKAKEKSENNQGKKKE